MWSYLQKLSISSTTEGSTIDVAPLGEEEVEDAAEDPSQPKACFTEGIKGSKPNSGDCTQDKNMYFGIAIPCVYARKQGGDVQPTKAYDFMLITKWVVAYGSLWQNKCVGLIGATDLSISFATTDLT